MLNINFWNIAFTVINLLVLYLFLKHFLMKPLMEIMEKRPQKPAKALKCSISGLYHLCQSPLPGEGDHCGRTGRKRA